MYTLQVQQDQVMKQQHSLDLLQKQLQSDAMKPPLIRINSDYSQFVLKTLDRNYDYNQFHCLTSINVDLNERNVFVEAGWTKMDGAHICDMILMDKVSVLTSWHR